MQSIPLEGNLKERATHFCSIVVFKGSSVLTVLNFDHHWQMHSVKDIVKAYAKTVGFDPSYLSGVAVNNVNFGFEEANRKWYAAYMNDGTFHAGVFEAGTGDGVGRFKTLEVARSMADALNWGDPTPEDAFLIDKDGNCLPNKEQE